VKEYQITSSQSTLSIGILERLFGAHSELASDGTWEVWRVESGGKVTAVPWRELGVF